ncbi:tubulin-tyrosine ligase family protein, putative [Ichthyophthirius multifiliis]|uniref:Tubulin-tyrosine ligase family protein, putative n=1 Tax=Ichthyophthirius multifiliis TaxID=5932 RepID=G0QLM9_ICHMU|nr:tubulin-tyrosine ligase family protein, putative [Ichthyophthirius multifiliis]EGR33875.1 tubulin-tyrosine ligase family protein, putative [Ichthyophthirius multifiliis]|eukprot:XP_004039099.1 tubulin-tyrosine ligase family protein, putative [Ichthyophthirius multifiliis]
METTINQQDNFFNKSNLVFFLFQFSKKQKNNKINRGWEIYNANQKAYTKYYFKWVQTLTEIDWPFFQEGQQIVNHIQNITIIANKSRLIQTIKEFEQKNKCVYEINSNHFLPETYRLDTQKEMISNDEHIFLNKRNISGIWINKPTNYNCGKGIQIVSDIKKFRDNFAKIKQSLKSKNSIQNNSSMILNKKQLQIPKKVLFKNISKTLFYQIKGNSILDVMYLLQVLILIQFYIILVIQDYLLMNIEMVFQKKQQYLNTIKQKLQVMQMKDIRIQLMQRFKKNILIFKGQKKILFGVNNNFKQQLYIIQLFIIFSNIQINRIIYQKNKSKICKIKLNNFLLMFQLLQKKKF